MMSTGRVLAAALVIGLASAPARGDTLSRVESQRSVMGTMFHIIVYHGSPPDAQKAVDAAMAEIVRLDRVMSHYKEDSDLSRLNRSAGQGEVVIEPSLYDVIEKSLAFSRLSNGRFDVTVGPLVRMWKQAESEGRRPSEAEIAEARRCVGYQKIETVPPDRVRVHSDCLAMDLGGIGKGYAVDKAIGILESHGIRHAMVNAGGSTIGAIGAPPGRDGWPVRLSAPVDGRSTLLLRDAAISTSQQNLVSLPLEQVGFGEIMDTASGVPIQYRASVSVVIGDATSADALSTTLLLTPVADASKLLEHFPNASALWTSPAGTLQREFRMSRLQLTGDR
jgi:thiamine biosynthesis lipoprotein